MSISIITIKFVSCLNHTLTIIFLGHVPCSLLDWFQSIHFWTCCGAILSFEIIQEFVYFFICKSLKATLRVTCNPALEFHFPWNEGVIPSRRKWLWSSKGSRSQSHSSAGLAADRAATLVLHDSQLLSNQKSWILFILEALCDFILQLHPFCPDFCNLPSFELLQSRNQCSSGFPAPVSIRTASTSGAVSYCSGLRRFITLRLSHRIFSTTSNPSLFVL